MSTTLVKTAVSAFREHERVALLLDQRARTLHTALQRIGQHGTAAERKDYVILTQQIAYEYSAMRDQEGL